MLPGTKWNRKSGKPNFDWMVFQMGPESHYFVHYHHTHQISDTIPRYQIGSQFDSFWNTWLNAKAPFSPFDEDLSIITSRVICDVLMTVSISLATIVIVRLETVRSSVVISAECWRFFRCSFSRPVVSLPEPRYPVSVKTRWDVFGRRGSSEISRLFRPIHAIRLNIRLTWRVGEHFTHFLWNIEWVFGRFTYSWRFCLRYRRVTTRVGKWVYFFICRIWHGN